jgi:hypothetical protein
MKLGLVLVSLTLAGLAPRLARAEGCRPPEPGSWEDAPKAKGKQKAAARQKAAEEEQQRGLVAATLEEGTAQLAAAKSLRGAAQRAKAVAAEQRFRDVEARVPCLPPTVVQLARSLRLQGRFLEASAQYRRLLDARAELDQQDFWKEWLDAAVREHRETQDQTPRLLLHLERNDCADSFSRVVLNHKSTRFESSMELDPGSYLVKAEAKGCTSFSRSIALAAGERGSIAVSLIKEPCRGFACNVPIWAKVTGGGVLVAGVGLVTYALLKPGAAEPTPYDCPSSPTHQCVQLR